MENNYKNFTIEDLEKFLLELCSQTKDSKIIIPIENLPELDEYNLKLYDEIIDKIKEGYCYTFTNKRLVYNEGERNFVISTGYAGAIRFISSYREQCIPANIVYDMITITDFERSISGNLRDISWHKITENNGK